MAAYMILRAFSWQLRLSPVPLPELCAALAAPDPTPLLDDVQVCLLRGLALDDNRATRSAQDLDLGLLDSVTWPEFVWEWLRGSSHPLGTWRNSPAAGVAVGVETLETHTPPGADPGPQATAGESRQGGGLDQPLTAMLVDSCDKHQFTLPPHAGMHDFKMLHIPVTCSQLHI